MCAAGKRRRLAALYASDRQYVCTTCPGRKAFDTRSALRAHERLPPHLAHAQHAHSRPVLVLRDVTRDIQNTQEQELSPALFDPADHDQQPMIAHVSALTQ